MTADADMPPRQLTDKGEMRRIGVELECAAISAHDGARLVQSLFGGNLRQEDPHRFHVEETEFGRFTCELDTQYAHGDYDEPMTAEPDALSEMLQEFRDGMRRVYGNISSFVVPSEIVCPPIGIDKLDRIETLVMELNRAGAQGTGTSPFYAFGAQLNPEIATRDARWLAAMIKSYLLISEWLRAIMEIDTTRRLTQFAAPFPPSYVSRVVAPDYWPDEKALIGDYLWANPTRNRELDMLPLFTMMDAPAVKSAVHDHRIKARPTFHYRLPDSRFGEAGWGLLLEWRRWLVIERLAEHPDILDQMGEAYLENRSRLLPKNWALKVSEWLILTRGL